MKITAKLRTNQHIPSKTNSGVSFKNIVHIHYLYQHCHIINHGTALPTSHWWGVCVAPSILATLCDALTWLCPVTAIKPTLAFANLLLIIKSEEVTLLSTDHSQPPSQVCGTGVKWCYASLSRIQAFSSHQNTPVNEHNIRLSTAINYYNRTVKC